MKHPDSQANSGLQNLLRGILASKTRLMGHSEPLDSTLSSAIGSLLLARRATWSVTLIWSAGWLALDSEGQESGRNVKRKVSAWPPIKVLLAVPPGANRVAVDGHSMIIVIIN